MLMVVSTTTRVPRILGMVTKLNSLLAQPRRSSLPR